MGVSAGPSTCTMSS